MLHLKIIFVCKLMFDFLKIIHIKKKIFKKKKHHHSEVSLHTHHNSLNEKDKNHQILAKVLNQY